MGLLNLVAIASSLHQVQREFKTINPQLSGQREPMDDAVIENLLGGYRFVDALLDADIDV